jgi:hypothetical protein
MNYKITVIFTTTASRERGAGEKQMGNAAVHIFRH